MEGLILTDKSTDDSLKEMEHYAKPLADEVKKMARDAVDLPSMPREAIIKSISGKYAKIQFTVKGDKDKDTKVPILQPNYKGGTSKLNLKKGNRVLIAYMNGRLGSPIIIGRLP